MSDMDYGRGTWHVGDDGSLAIYAHGGVEVVRLELTPLQLIGLARDMNRAAWLLMAKVERGPVPFDRRSPMKHERG